MFILKQLMTGRGDFSGIHQTFILCVGRKINCMILAVKTIRVFTSGMPLAFETDEHYSSWQSLTDLINRELKMGTKGGIEAGMFQGTTWSILDSQEDFISYLPLSEPAAWGRYAS